MVRPASALTSEKTGTVKLDFNEAEIDFVYPLERILPSDVVIEVWKPKTSPSTKDIANVNLLE